MEKKILNAGFYIKIKTQANDGSCIEVIWNCILMCLNLETIQFFSCASQFENITFAFSLIT